MSEISIKLGWSVTGNTYLNNLNGGHAWIHTRMVVTNGGGDPTLKYSIPDC